MKAFDFLATFIGGALVGAACGLLFAPEKGSDLREKIAEALRKAGRKPRATKKSKPNTESDEK